MTRQQRRIPYIKSWSPLELAETQLFPTIPPHQLTKAQRDQALALAKQMLAERTGYVMEP